MPGAGSDRAVRLVKERKTLMETIYTGIAIGSTGILVSLCHGQLVRMVPSYALWRARLRRQTIARHAALWLLAYAAGIDAYQDKYASSMRMKPGLEEAENG
jgi:hypothetical protein